MAITGCSKQFSRIFNFFRSRPVLAPNPLPEAAKRIRCSDNDMVFRCTRSVQSCIPVESTKSKHDDNGSIIFNSAPIQKSNPPKVFNTRSIQRESVMQFHTTAALSGEPLKKRRRVDPAILREKAEKKKRRLMKDIRKLEKVARKPKPITELEAPRKIFHNSDRVRPTFVLSEDEIQRRSDLDKEWAIYKYHQHLNEMNAIGRMVASQEKALDALQEASPELYEQALKIDEDLIPFKMTGPVNTPPIENYDVPEGDYQDVTKKYLPIVPIEVKKRKVPMKKK